LPDAPVKENRRQLCFAYALILAGFYCQGIFSPTRWVERRQTGYSGIKQAVKKVAACLDAMVKRLQQN
jgi:hypothetical protein